MPEVKTKQKNKLAVPIYLEQYHIHTPFSLEGLNCDPWCQITFSVASYFQAHLHSISLWNEVLPT